MISGLAVVLWARFRQDGNFFEGARSNADLLLHFPDQGVTGSLASVAMSTDDIPDAGIEDPLGRPSGQQHLISPNQQPARADPHGLPERSEPAARYIERLPPVRSTGSFGGGEIARSISGGLVDA